MFDIWSKYSLIVLFCPSSEPRPKMKFELNEFCPPNETLLPHFLSDKGVSPCFTETVISSASVLYMLLFGSMQLLLYKRYATPVQHYALPFSQLYGLQVIFF